MSFRYPGGKRKVKKEIAGRILRFYRNDKMKNRLYIEPFFGAGAICLNLLSSQLPTNKILINDIDPGIASYWQSVIKTPKELCELVKDFKPSVDLFYEYKDILLKLKPEDFNKDDCLQIGFMKLAIHQISYSGLGTLAGGPIGGKNQKSKYDVGCRWNALSIIKNIWKEHHYLKTVTSRFDCRHFIDIFFIYDAVLSFYYLDPPYFVKGGELYQHSFTEEDHNLLAQSLKMTSSHWLLSYDDCEEIRELYDWAEIIELNMNYSINGAVTKKELLITHPRFKDLLEPIKEDEIVF